MNLNEALDGLLDAERKLRNREAMISPTIISEQMYRLGQYASAVEKELGDIEDEYEREWANDYKQALEDKLSATAAKQQADVANADSKGQIKRLSRYVSSAWKVHMGAMARINHLIQENKGSV